MMKLVLVAIELALIISVQSVSVERPYHELTLDGAEIGGSPLNLTNFRDLLPSIDYLDSISTEVTSTTPSPPPSDTSQVITTLNEYADRIMDNLSGKIIALGYDPLKIADMKTGFSWKFMFIRYHGEIELTAGWLVDLSRVHRDGDVLLIYNSTDGVRTISLVLPMRFDDLMFTYDYLAKLMNIGPTGGITGQISNVKMIATFSFNCDTQEAYLDRMDVQSGRISIHFTGHFLLDWMSNLLSDVVLALLHSGILKTLHSYMSSVLSNAVIALNGVISHLVNP